MSGLDNPTLVTHVLPVDDRADAYIRVCEPAFAGEASEFRLVLKERGIVDPNVPRIQHGEEHFVRGSKSGDERPDRMLPGVG